MPDVGSFCTDKLTQWVLLPPTGLRDISLGSQMLMLTHRLALLSLVEYVSMLTVSLSYLSFITEVNRKAKREQRKPSQPSLKEKNKS